MNPHLKQLWANTDKIILSVLLIVCLIIHVHMVGALGDSIDPAEAQQVNWLENIIGQILAAILTLLVTHHRAQKTLNDQNQKEKEGEHDV